MAEWLVSDLPESHHAAPHGEIQGTKDGFRHVRRVGRCPLNACKLPRYSYQCFKVAHHPRRTRGHLTKLKFQERTATSC